MALRNLIIDQRTTGRNKTITSYFNDIRHRKILTTAEEYELALKAQEGDEDAIIALVDANLRFVISIAKQYGATNPDKLSEYIAQGNIGLLYSARTFDPTRGFKFVSYAVWHIRKEILHYLNYSSRMIRIPNNVLNALGKVKKLEDSVLQKNERPATEDELEYMLYENEVMFSRGNIIKAKNVYQKPKALDSSPFEDALTPIELLKSSDSADNLTKPEDLEKLVSFLSNCLTDRQIDVIILYYGLLNTMPTGFTDIGIKYNKTKEWARLEYNKAIRKLRQFACKNKITPEDFDFLK
jgi:RNA polymerase primary sigma factor